MSDSPVIRDIIDLTADLSDLESRERPNISSAHNDRQTSIGELDHHDSHHGHARKTRKLSEASDRHQHHNHHHHRKAKLIGEPLSVKSGKFESFRQATSHREKGEERVCSGVQYGKLLIEIGAMVVCNHPASVSRRGLVRSINERIFDRHKTELVCHVHWMSPSDCGEPQEVFLKHKSCSDVALRSITRVQALDIGPGQTTGDHPFLRHVYNHGYEEWRDPVLVDKGGLPVCDSCQAPTKSTPRRTENAWEIDGIKVHRHDFILFEPKAEKAKSSSAPSTLIWLVGHVLDLNDEGFVVQVLDRYSDWAKTNPSSGAFISERRLLLSSDERDVATSEVMKKILVTFDQDTDAGPDRFYCRDRVVGHRLVTLAKPMRTCHTCVKESTTDEAAYQDFKRQVSLPAIDYYSGGGGGMIGARGLFSHKHAVEMEGYACDTLEHNFPKTTVHCALVGEASEAARSQGRRLIDRRDQDVEGGKHRRRVSRLPEPGSMVLASAGPPCQGHTGANHQNQVADVRNDELFVVIQEVARLRPDIFIRENVPGMKRDRDGDGEGVEVGNFAVEGIRRLRGLGYQIRLVQLDSRSFGSPQNRNRLFIICARKGVPLPSIPEPTHTNPVLKVNNFFSSGAVTHRPFYVGSKGAPGSGPLAAITVRDAISDLPRWEYIHDGARSTRIPRFIAHPGRDGRTRVGFLKPVQYAHSPTNDYQKAQRDLVSKVSQHYTPPRSDRELALVVQTHTSTDGSIPGNAQRIDPDSGASTLLTSSGPGGKYTRPVHYDQVRTLTIAERKRIQGVPDDYVLHGRIGDKDRQVGNMINVHMSSALNGHIRREVFFPAWMAMGKPQNFLERWRAKHPI